MQTNILFINNNQSILISNKIFADLSINRIEANNLTMILLIIKFMFSLKIIKKINQQKYLLKNSRSREIFFDVYCSFVHCLLLN